MCPGAGRHAGAIGREGNRPTRGERSERPVAVPTAPAKLIKSGYAVDPAAGDRASDPASMDVTNTRQKLGRGRRTHPALLTIRS